MDNKKITILAIDDNHDNLISLKALIHEAFPNSEYISALDGGRGIELAALNDPDVILLDILMPVMDGYEVCRRLKADKHLYDIPVVFITALKGDKESRICALESGGDAFISKPIDESELTAQIRAMVKIKKANCERRDEKERLSQLVLERTRQLEQELAERKKTLDALKESEERFKHVFEVANVGKSITLPTGEINVNQAFCDILGYTKDELINKRWQDITHPEDIEKSQKVVDLLLDGLQSKSRVNKRFLHKNGTVIWADVSVALLRDQHGAPLIFITTVVDISERIKTEEELRHSEELFKCFVQNSSDLTTLTDENNTLLFVSPQCERILGFSGEQFVGKNLPYNIHPDDNDRCLKLWELVKSDSEEITDVEYRIFDSSGSMKWVSHSAKLVKVDSNVLGIQSTIHDITERKKAEENIREREMRLRSTFDQSPVGAVIVGLDKRFIKCNAAFCRFLGYTQEELIGKLIEDVTFSEDVEIGMADLKLIVEGKKESAFLQKRYQRKDGSVVWGEVSISMGRDANNNPLCFLPIIQDITDRKQNEDKLRILSLAMEQSPDSIIITNTKGEIEFVNPALVSLSGYSVDELIGQNPRIFSSGEKPKEEYQKLLETIIDGQIWEGEFLNKKKSGELFWESATISPVFDNNFKIIHYLAIRKDITEQKKMTQSLIEAKEHAEESDRLKSSFLANMSHEIRTPMNSIMGFASLLPEEESRELMVQYANIIVQNSEQLVSLIDSIVMYSKLQTGLFTYRPATFEARRLLDEVEQSFNLPMNELGVKLKSEYNLCTNIQIHSDYDKLRQIISNLVVNAFKYTKNGEIVLGCNHSGDRFEFFVRDTGIGIPQKDINHIFERFYRGSNIDEASTRGTGLGLSIVKELVEMLGGEIWVESEVNKGSAFYFTLPDKENILQYQ